MKPRMSLSSWVLVMGVVGCGTTKNDVATGGDGSEAVVVRPIAIPGNLIVLDPNAAGFRVPVDHPFLCMSWIRLDDVVGRESPLFHGPLSLVLVQNDRAWFVDHFRRGDEIGALLAPGATYVLMERPSGPAGDAYELLRQVGTLETELPPGIPDDICERILCPDPAIGRPQPAEVLLREFPALRPFEDRLILEGREIGWFPGSECERCLGGITPGGGGGPGSEDCSSSPDRPGEPPCRDEGWNDRFNADFNAMATGQPPSTSPQGDPPGDKIALEGPPAFRVVQDVALASNALKVTRTGSPKSSHLTATLDGGAVRWGRVCIDFKVRRDRESEGPYLIELLSTREEAIAEILIQGGSYDVIGNNGPVRLNTEIPVEGSDHVHLEVFLDAGYFTMHLNQKKQKTQPLNQTICRDFESLRMTSPGSILESDALHLYFDDVHIRAFPGPTP